MNAYEGGKLAGKPGRCILLLERHETAIDEEKTVVVQP